MEYSVSSGFPPGTATNTAGGQDLVANGVAFDQDGDLFVADTARDAGLTDYRVQVNVGASAGQTIFHLHWHVLGGRMTGMPG